MYKRQIQPHAISPLNHVRAPVCVKAIQPNFPAVASQAAACKIMGVAIAASIDTTKKRDAIRPILPLSAASDAAQAPSTPRVAASMTDTTIS